MSHCVPGNWPPQKTFEHGNLDTQFGLLLYQTYFVKCTEYTNYTPPYALVGGWVKLQKLFLGATPDPRGLRRLTTSQPKFVAMLLYLGVGVCYWIE